MSKIENLLNDNFREAMNVCKGKLSELMTNICSSLDSENIEYKSIYGGFGICVSIEETDQSDKVSSIIRSVLEENEIPSTYQDLIFTITKGQDSILVVQKRG